MRRNPIIGWLVALGTCLISLAGSNAASAQAPAGLPACDPAVPAALAFDGLASRVPYGYEERFELRETDSPRTADSAVVAMTLADSAAPFFMDEVSLDDLLFVRLDLGDPAALVQAAFKETDTESGAECARVIQRRVAGFRRMLIPSRCDRGTFRPRRILLACGDGNFYLTRITWSGWNGAVAVGRGLARANDCNPFCVNGRFHSYQVRLQASRLRSCAGDRGLRYTRLRITYVGRKPPGARRSVIPFDCSP